MEEAGVIFYNGGFDFVLLEIESKQLNFNFNKEGSLIKLVPNETVSDGKWHKLILRYNAVMAELILDDKVYRGTHDNDTKPTINLEKSVFIGGVQEDMRRRLWHKGLRINDQSFMGCMKDVQINNQDLGFPQMNKSQHLALNCVWKYPCVEFEPCLKSGYCNQYGVDEFICYCDQSYCIKADFQGPFKVGNSMVPELISITSTFSI